ncbi:E3 ubiquitin-protein ligase TRIM33 isoform X2 [Tribolium madens]|uniref:E3 ubiquitin-protein ligase TRIM33 isoform X2 n=1 Tax=Tribolium madens TaxID=41895 RepID=UPI001CF76429|nr:E3 ubiquitin-protein ligase TRIM33 isoform X2 [Tribolium madens]
MAESNIYYNESNYMNHQESTDKDVIDSVQNLTEQSEMICDDSLVEESKDEAKEASEEHVESPTTGAFTFKCVFCEQVLSGGDEPKLLECLHNACGTCIGNKLYETELEKNTVECPQCNIVCEPNKIIDNQFLANNEDNSAKLADLKCSSCSDDAIATSWCVDCSEYICDSCVQAHQRLKITKDHTIKAKEEGVDNQSSSSNTSPNLFCLSHPQEKLSLFCETCDKLTCRDCQLIEHREHKYKFTNEIASETRKFIADMLKDVGYKRALLNSAMKVIDDRQNLIVDKKQALVKEITQLVVKLTNTINVRGKQLVSKLTEVCDSKQKTLQEKKQALEQLSRMTDHCIEFTQHALDNGSDMALLYSKKQVTDHLRRIKCKRADIPNPEIPVRIHLALDKFPDLVKGLSTVMSTIGQIVVDGRIYPSQSVSPSPHGSPSPGHSRQSPINQILQQSPPYQQQGGFQQSPRLPPPYGQFGNGPQYPQNQNISPKMMGPPIPISLAQQLGANRMQMPRQMPRPLLPRMNSMNQQQVSSSTHPQNMLSDRSNLRCLLQPVSSNSPVYIQTGPAQYQAVQPHMAQQYQNRFPPNQQPQQQQQQQAFRQQPPMPMMMNQNRPQRQFQMQTGGSARWHIPQQQINNNNIQGGNRNMTLPTINDNFKITLKQQQTQENCRNLPATVTSTIPKTPSPNHIQGRSDTERSLDKFCEDSVKDLMATIAKLDSNGVQVVAEGRQKGGSPHVDSSTGDAGPSGKIKSDPMETGKDDPNEDWCAVCMDGGELVCCDKCPKVFHQYCHIPNLSVEENDTWQCLLCTNFADFSDEVSSEKKEGELCFKDKKIAERIVLELYCQYDPSLPFREVIGPENEEYHAIIKNPIALDSIRQKLNWNSAEHYTSMEQLVKDVRLMFKNAYTYNPEDSQVYADAKVLEKFFDEQLEKFLPEYAYEHFDDDDDIQPPNKKYRRIISD